MKPHRSIRILAGLLLSAVHLSLLSAADPPSQIVFTDVTESSGIQFMHVMGASPEKFYVETMGSGACWLDYDGDKDIDLYVVNSAPLPGHTGDPNPINHLYRNEGNARFLDVTEEAGVGHPGYGMGCAAADLENDGDQDLYVTNFNSPNVLYRNDGNGRFTDVTAEAGVGGGGWSASAAFADIDNDGDLDLYVTRYIDFTVETNRWCGQRKPGYRAYCHPDEYNGVTDRLFRNKGDGRFEDVSVAAGIASPVGKGLGVVFTDIDGDGWQDMYVANDKTTNFLYHNQRDGTFMDISLTAGVGFSGSGKVQAGMGTDAGDVNGDGLMDLVVTNLDFETNELYVSNGDMSYIDATFQAGLGQINFLNVGFGIDMLDYDNDGDKDILIMNGHIIDNIHLTRDEVTYLQPRSLLANDSTGRFEEVGSRLGPDFAVPNVGRGVAVGDMDNDGDLDFFVVNSNRKAQLMRNDGGSAAGHWLLLELTGSRSNRDGVGARVRVQTRDASGAERWQVDEVKAGSSYCSRNDLRLHFGLGAAELAKVIEVRWPSGAVQTLENVKADQILAVNEPPAP